jgi:hypothetical protein
VAEIRQPGRTLSLPPLREAGTYFWTLRAETAEGFDISAPEPRSFRVLPMPLLTEPENRLPQTAYDIGPAQLRENRRLTFSWNPVPGATGYIFTLSRETPAGLQQLVRTPPQPGTSWELEDLADLAPAAGENSLRVTGNFVWQVEAVTAGPSGIYQRGTPGVNTFTLDIPLPQDARLLNPERMYGK